MLRTNLFLLAAPLLILAGLAFADPPDANPFLLDTTIVWSVAPGSQGPSSVAFDDANYLVVWSDGREGMPTCTYAARVTQDGVTLDTVGFRLPLFTSYCPAVAHGHGSSLVVWFGYDDFSSVAVYGARVRRDGQVLDSNGFRISSPQEPLARNPAVAFDGENWLVVWQNGNYGGLHGQRVDTSGRVLDTLSFTIAGLSWLNPGKVTFDGTNYVVVWRQLFTGIECVRVSPDGQILEPGVITISVSDSADAPVVSSDQTNAFVVWRDTRYGILGARVNPEGIVIDTTPIAVSRQHNSNSPVVSFNGTDYLVAWMSSGGNLIESYAARVTPNGRVLDTLAMQLYSDSCSSGSLGIASGDSNSLVVWSRTKGGDADIFGDRVSSNGAVLDSSGFRVVAGPQSQNDADVAFGGNAYLAVWTENRTGTDSTDIYGIRASAAGALLDPRPFAISSRPDKEVGACVAAGDSCYLVAWEQPHANPYTCEVYCSRVSFTGAKLDSGIKLTSGSYTWNPALGFAHGRFLAVYVETQALFTRTVSQSGALGDSFLLDSHRFNTPNHPKVAFNGTNYLVAWQREYGLSGDTICVYSIRVDSSGAPLDSAARLITRNAEQTYVPAVASDQAGYLVVWDYTGRSEVWGSRVSADGVVLDSAGFQISPSGAAAWSPAVCFDGQDYVVVWKQKRPASYDYDLHGARVSPSGVVVDTFPAVTVPGRQSESALAQGPDGQMLLTYSGFADSVNGRPANATRIWGKLSPFVGLADANRTARTSQVISARPNPFRSSLFIHLTTRPLDHSTTSARIYDAAGRLIASSAEANSALVATSSGYVWKPSSDTRAGVYVIRVQTAERTATTRVVFTP